MNIMYDIYEKLYFKSLDDRERVIGRSQINFTIYTGILALFFYMLRMIDYDSSITYLVVFFATSLISCILVFISAYYTWIALTEGYDYKYLPKCSDISKYHRELNVYIKNVESHNDSEENKISCPNPEEDLKIHLLQRMEECVDNNNDLNSLRMKTIRFSMLWLWSGVVFFLISSLVFAASDLDVSSPRKETLILDRSVSNELHSISYQINSLRGFIMPQGQKDSNQNQPKSHNDNESKKPIPPTFPRSQVVTENYKEKPNRENRR